jgi:mannosylglycoprotein endo-beta-mannosidase
MGYMGFGRKWRAMIYECLSSSKLSVLINGSHSKEFSVRGGLRQGDPISPFLFDIATEGLSVLFQRASSENIIKGLQFTSGIFVSHLQYADDTLIFILADIDQLVQVKRILRWFALTSGLHINFNKSSIIGINVDDHLCLRLATSIFCRSDSLPSKYLGMPLGVNLSRISTWKPVIKKFHKRLHMWKGRLLSMAVCLCLIKSVFNSLPIYFMSVFKMP